MKARFYIASVLMLAGALSVSAANVNEMGKFGNGRNDPRVELRDKKSFEKGHMGGKHMEMEHRKGAHGKDMKMHGKNIRHHDMYHKNMHRKPIEKRGSTIIIRIG